MKFIKDFGAEIAFAFGGSFGYWLTDGKVWGAILGLFIVGAIWFLCITEEKRL
ncbi:hypothetical protein SEA_NICEHOUSE_204 [Rhodococcus phage NiceHouse]|nr:hypothetical protein SEA_NICEHOUSE_204 [Rhodococcus phage NiceHouse]